MTRCALIYLGAHNFQKSGLTSSEKFRFAHNGLKEYFSHSQGLDINEESTLNLFDSPYSSSDQLQRISDFLKITDDSIEYIYYIYIGHGCIRPTSESLFVAINDTHIDNIFGTSIEFRSLYDSFRKYTSHKKIVGILDCCFASSALASSMNAGYEDVLKRELERSDHFPNGSMIICSSGPNEYAYLSDDQNGTQFTSAALDILSNSWGQDNPDIISGHDLVELTRSRLAIRKKQDQTPHIFDVDQREGLLSKIPLFPILKLPIPASAHAIDIEGRIMDDIDQEEIIAAYGLENFSLHFTPRALDVLRASNIHSHAYSYKARIKNSSDILKKMSRKRSFEERPNYSVSDVTDVVGVRIITLFNRDVFDVVNELISLLSGQSNLNPNCLSQANINEFKLYTTDNTLYPTSDISIMCEKIHNVLKMNGYDDISPEIIVRQDYSSVHLVVSVPAEFENTQKINSLPIEFQIRTVFEDTWAQVDHHLRYSRTRIKNSEHIHNSPIFLEKGLIILKKYIDNCAEFAELLREEHGSERAKDTRIVSMDSNTDFVNEAKRLELRPEFISSVSSILSMRDKYDVEWASQVSKENAQFEVGGLRDLQHRFANLAERLFELRGSEEENVSRGGLRINEKISYSYYTLRMEEAYCRIRSDLDDEKSESLRIYRDVSHLFPNAPILHIRLGQAASKNGRFEEAIKAYHICINNLDTELDHTWLITDIQREYANQNVHRLLGFAHWGLYSKLIESDIIKAVESLIEAWKSTYLGLTKYGKLDGKERFVNNLICYYLEYSKLLSENVILEPIECFDSDWFMKFAREFVDNADLDSCNNVSRLETIVRAAVTLGDIEIAERAARIIMELVSTQNSGEFFGRSSVEVATATAWSVLSRR